MGRCGKRGVEEPRQMPVIVVRAGVAEEQSCGRAGKAAKGHGSRVSG